MAKGIWDLVRTPPVSNAAAVLRPQLENREQIFLETLRRAVFSRPGHPYAQMFQLAGCEFPDLAASVRRDGLERTLDALHRNGVFLSHDEFKGKTPILRAGRHIASDGRSFLNPLAKGLIEGSTSGSRSGGTRTPQSTRFALYREAHDLLLRREFDLDRRRQIETKSILPDVSGLRTCLRTAHLGREVDRWFAAGGSGPAAHQYRLATNALILLARFAGARVPFPRYLPFNDFSPIAEWIAQRKASGLASWVSILVSPAVRVAAAAIERGLDISGTLFQVGGEALTDAKRRAIEAAGVQICAGYWIGELGFIGHSCRQMRTGNSVHLFHDSVAVISHTKTAPLSGTPVRSLLFTSLLPFAPRILINAEMDDSGIIEPVRCHCTFARAGFTTAIRDIYSFGKLTGQGVTLVGSDVVRILEELLPARLGGGPGDYQLVEQEGPLQTQLTLRASPRAGTLCAEQVRRCFLGELSRVQGGTVASRIWNHSEGLRVEIAEPFATGTGKVHVLHLLKPESTHAHTA